MDLAPFRRPAKAPELSAKVIGTWVGSTTAGPPRKSVASRAMLVGANGAEVKAAFARRSNGESGVSKISRKVCANP